MKRPALLLVACIVFFAVACGGGSSTSSSGTSTPSRPQARGTEQPVPTAYVFPTATAVPATPTPQPPLPTPTEVPPTPTPEPPPAPPPPAPPPPAPASQPAAPPASAGSSTLVFTASTLLFSPTAASVSAGANVTVIVDNKDILVAHDIGLKGGAKANQCTGPCQTSFSFKAPGAGSYQLICSLHPDTMVIALTVR